MSMLNQYVFEVTKDANKIEIAQAVEQLIKDIYPKSKSKVTAVNTSAIRGRFRSRKRHGAHPKDSKKAIVTISGDPLDIYQTAE
jgi:large subunit ribosomal protein L23